MSIIARNEAVERMSLYTRKGAMFKKLIEQTARKTRLFEIDFSHAWWRIFTFQLPSIFCVLSYNIIDLGVFAALPLVISYLIMQQKVWLTLLIISG